MQLEEAIELVKKIVKNNGVNGESHIDLGLVSTEERPVYEKALIVSQLAIKSGKITKDDFERRTNLDR